MHASAEQFMPPSITGNNRVASWQSVEFNSWMLSGQEEGRPAKPTAAQAMWVHPEKGFPEGQRPTLNIGGHGADLTKIIQRDTKQGGDK